MKVDKSVCTSNDALFAVNTATNELNSIIKFETVFTTLVENKILAIKRECEEHDSKKKSRTLKSILSRKGDEKHQSDSGGVKGRKKKSQSFFLRHKNKQLEVDLERGESEPQSVPPPAELVKVEVQSDEPPANVDSQSNECVKLHEGKPNCDKLLVNSSTENAQLPLSTNNSSNVHSNKTIKESSPPHEPDESLATTIDLSLQQSSKALPINAQPVSDIAICDDGVSSQNTSDIEFSLVSESISELPVQPRKKILTNSDPIIKKPPQFLSPPLKREVKVIERKAISCQSTPLFGRHQAQLKHDGEVKKVLTFQELPKKIGEPKVAEKAKSQTIVIAPTSTTTTTTLAKLSGPVETVHSNRKAQKHSKCRDVSVEYEISYDDDEGNQSPRGFISSFNQLTSQMPPAAVITTNLKKQSSKQAKAQSTKDGRNQQESVVDDKTAKHHEIELELDELAIDVVNKKKRRRSELRTRVEAGLLSIIEKLFNVDSSSEFIWEL